MPAEKIAGDATLHNLTGPLEQRKEYVRLVLKNFPGTSSDNTVHVLRIGVQGTGQTPHYRFEPQSPISPDENIHSKKIVFNGRNHEEMTAFKIEEMRDEHWSSKTMDYLEVQTLLGDLRGFKKKT